LEAASGLSSSFVGGGGDISIESNLWVQVEKEAHRKSKAEAKIRGKILNHFTKLGMPKF